MFTRLSPAGRSLFGLLAMFAVLLPALEVRPAQPARVGTDAAPVPFGLTFRHRDGDMFFAARSGEYSVDASGRLTVALYTHENRKFDFMARPRVELERFPLAGPLVAGTVVRHAKNCGTETLAVPWASMYIGIHTVPCHLVIEFLRETPDGWLVAVAFDSEDAIYYDGRAKPQRTVGRFEVRRRASR